MGLSPGGRVEWSKGWCRLDVGGKDHSVELRGSVRTQKGVLSRGRNLPTGFEIKNVGWVKVQEVLQ